MPYRRTGLTAARMRKAKSALHAPKKFVMYFKLLDVIPDLSGSHVDGWTKWNLKINEGQVPGSAELNNIYKQFAITGVQYQYKTLNISGSNIDDQPSVSMLFAEDKANVGAVQNKNLRSQDNVRVFRSTQNFKHYVRYPRPELYQLDNSGNQMLTIQSSKQIQWFDTQDRNAIALNHLAAQFQVEDLPSGVVNKNKQGEIWAKVYLLFKEQAVA